jgi:uncharacterized protein
LGEGEDTVAGEGREREEVIGAIRLELAARLEILFACLHGSFQWEEPSRDIDVAVWLDPSSASRRNPSRYAIDLSAALERAAGRRVDVQVLNEAPLAFRFHALQGEPLLVRDWEAFDEMRARTWDEYFDFLPFAREYSREVFRA